MNNNDDNHILVSIVVPIYNVSQYLDKCVNSICNQTYRNLEIILVDDGSTDDSKLICDKWASKDLRIKVIHKENQGLVSARKTGVAVAKGQYMLHVDGDDWIETDMVEFLLNKALEYSADIVTSGAYRDYGNGTTEIEQDALKEGIYNHDEIIENVYSVIKNGNSVKPVLYEVWCKLSKTSINKELYNGMNTAIKMGEDSAVTYSELFLIKKLYISQRIFYHYNIRSGSITNNDIRDCRYMTRLDLWYNFIIKNLNGLVYDYRIKCIIDRTYVWYALIGINRGMGLSPDAHIPEYIIPDYIYKYRSVIIYGAGVIGKCYHDQILRHNDINCVAWTDKRAYTMGKEIQPVSCINKYDFDTVLKAVKEKQAADSIKEDLVNIYRVDEKKIYWERPKTIWEMF